MEILFNKPDLPVDHPLTPFALAMIQALRLLFLIIAVWFVKNVLIIGWLVWDRREQRQEREKERKEQAELYHTTRNLLAATKGRLDIEKVQREMAVKEIKDEVKKVTEKVPEPTADAVVEKIKTVMPVPDSGQFPKPPGGFPA